MASRNISDAELRILLVGKTGSGKSATANTIVGRRLFKADPSSQSCTKTCQVESATVLGRKILVVDSPGFFDTSGHEGKIRHELNNFATLSAPGPHVIIYVVGGRFTNEEIETAKKLRGLFGPGLEKHLIVLITKTETWEDDEQGEPMTARKYMMTLPPSATGLLSNQVCQYRSIAFTNVSRMATYKSQVMDLFKLIDDVKESNGGGYYSDKHWEEANSELVKRAERILQQNPGMSWDTAIERARKEAIGPWCSIL